ncbi:MAG: hypothetical protein IPL24_13625 [Bacteroidetes bacterium]|nr:hypothetical protein [Bacteroidota bacterium]
MVQVQDLAVSGTFKNAGTVTISASAIVVFKVQGSISTILQPRVEQFLQQLGIQDQHVRS